MSRETSEDRVAFPESHRDHLCSRPSKLNPVVCGFLRVEGKALTLVERGKCHPQALEPP